MAILNWEATSKPIIRVRWHVELRPLEANDPYGRLARLTVPRVGEREYCWPKPTFPLLIFGAVTTMNEKLMTRRRLLTSAAGLGAGLTVPTALWAGGADEAIPPGRRGSAAATA
jgi:hypothetical protein